MTSELAVATGPCSPSLVSSEVERLSAAIALTPAARELQRKGVAGSLVVPPHWRSGLRLDLLGKAAVNEFCRDLLSSAALKIFEERRGIGRRAARRRSA